MILVLLLSVLKRTVTTLLSPHDSSPRAQCFAPNSFTPTQGKHAMQNLGRRAEAKAHFLQLLVD